MDSEGAAGRPDVTGILVAAALISLSVFTLPVLLHAVLFLLGQSMSTGSVVAGIGLGLVVPAAVYRDRRSLLAGYAVVALVIAVSVTVQLPSWDNAHDSLVYHEPAATAIAGGMNPVFEDTGIMWVDHYPKAAWVFSAGVYRLSGSIESGKVLTGLAALACFGVALAFFGGMPRVRPWLAWSLALLVALNPVVLAQFDTHYVDGLFADLGTLLVLVALAYDARGELPGVPGRVAGAIAALAAIPLANLKFTGLVFVVLLVAVAALRHWRKNRARPPRAAVVWITVAAIGIAIVGADPYVTNTIGNGHPFYPVFGADLSEVEDPPDIGQRPVAYRDAPAPVAFLMSLADTTRAGSQDTMPEAWRPKNPLSVTRAELAAMTFPDPRTGGFGPLFFLCVLLAVVCLLLVRVRSRGDDFVTARSTLWYGLAVVLLVTVAMGEAWWARLAPVFFLAPVLVAAAGLSGALGGGGLRRAAATTLAVVLVANSLLGAGAVAFDYRNRWRARSATLDVIGDATEASIRFPDHWAEEHQSRAFARRLEDLGISVRVVPYDSTSTGEWVPLPGQPAELLVR